VLAAGLAGTVAATVMAAPALAAPATGTLAGIVRDSKGAAVAGAGIEIHLSTMGAALATGRTDSAGRFKVPALAPGTYEVEILLVGGWTDWAPGHAGNPAHPGSYRVTAGHTTVAKSVVAAAGTVVGRITDSTGQPAGNVPLVLTALEDTHGFSATTAADGTYSVTVEPDSTYVVQYTIGALREFVPHTFNSTQAGQYPVPAGQTVRIDDQAAAAASGAGRLVDAAGAPVGDATVTFHNWSTDNEYKTTTGADGSYRIDGLPVGPYKVKFSGSFGTQYAYQKLDLFSADTITLTSGTVTTVDDRLLG
jgi:hypothetical protein